MNDMSAYSSAPLYSFGMLSSLSRCIGHYQDPFISSSCLLPSSATILVGFGLLSFYDPTHHDYIPIRVFTT
jgi:hypothetical protein